MGRLRLGRLRTGRLCLCRLWRLDFFRHFAPHLDFLDFLHLLPSHMASLLDSLRTRVFNLALWAIGWGGQNFPHHQGMDNTVQAMPAFVINLDRDASKMANVTARLGREGLQFERIAAVDGSSLQDDEIRRRCTATCGEYCPKAAIGCFLSHIEAWKKVVERGLDKALILEDDVGFRPGGLQVINQALAELPDEWHVLLCGCFTCQKEMGTEKLAGFLRGAPPAKEVSAHLRIPSQTYGSQSYVVSQTGARTLLELLPKPTWHVDWAMGAAMRKGLKLFSTKPNATYQVDMNESSIASRAPTCLNSIANLIPLDAGDERSVGWIMSIPLFSVWHLNVSPWCCMFLALAVWQPFWAVGVLVVDMAGALWLTSDLRGYAPLLLTTYLGVVMRAMGGI